MSSITPFNFDGRPIRVVTDDNGEPWFAANEVCEILGFANPRDAVARHVDEDDVGKRDTIDGLGRKQLTNHVNESGMYALIFGSTKPEAKRFKRWVTSEVLPSIRRTGSYAGPGIQEQLPTPLRDQVDAGILLLRAAAEDLKFAPSALLGSYQKLENHVGVAGLLPAYAVDASSTSTAGSSEETKSAKDLLNIHGVGMSAVAFNRLLLQRGFLEERERPSTKGSGLKKFKVCANLVFGKNLTAPGNPRETQPHWYVSKFAELLDLVLPTKRGAAA
jgi:prophage antirepressor-like protein